MILNRFYVHILLRIILLSITCLFFTWSWTNLHHLFTFVSLGILFIIQVVHLIYYINKVNRDLNLFFTSLQSGEPTTSFVTSPEKSDRKGMLDLAKEILKTMENVRIEKEYHYQYLKYIIEHVDVGLLSFEESGRVDLINVAFRKLLNIPSIKNISYLNFIHPDFAELLDNLVPGQQKLIMVQINENVLYLVLRTSKFILQDKNMKLVSIQNIRTQLDEKELVSWQKLIRVLTHEIMNSVSPISSLTTTLSRIFRRNNRPVELDDLTESQIRDVAKGLDIIGMRSKGLLQFVKEYRRINLLPKPEIISLRGPDLFSHIKYLFEEELARKNIILKVTISPEKLYIKADEKLVQQILINLMRNSIDALEGVPDPVIYLKAFENSNRQSIIQIQDNGYGIPPDILDSIFVPFFTTKEDGSGIGLNLARQIMHLHKGTITVQSDPGKRTVFTLVFPGN